MYKSFRGILYDTKADLLAGIIAEWNSGSIGRPGVSLPPEKEVDYIIDYFSDEPESRDWLAEYGLTHNDLVRANAEVRRHAL